MTTVTKSVEIEIVEMDCCNSYVALTQSQFKEFRRSHKNFYCPKGHPRHYPDESDIERLERLNSNLHKKVGELRSHNDGLLTVITSKDKRYKRLAEKGVCPDCRRNFVNVARHMKTKHSNARSVI